MIRGLGLLAGVLLAGIACAEPTCTPEQGLAQSRQHARWHKAFLERRFDELDRELEGLLERVRDGRTTDVEADDAFEIFDNAGPDKAVIHEAWIAAKPKSEAASLAYTYALFTKARYLRGGAYANQTSKAQFDAMAAALERADAQWQRTVALASRPTVEALLRLPMLQYMASHKAVRAYYDKAIAASPQSVGLRRGMIFTSLPQWGGSLEEMEEIAASGAKLPEAHRRYLRSYADAWEGRFISNNLDKDLEALPFLEKSLAACPGMYGVAEKIIKIRSKTRGFKEIIPATDAYIARFPGSGYGYNARGWAKGNLGRYEDAYADYMRAAERGYMHAYFILGTFYEMGRAPVHRDLRRALDYYEIADKKQDPDAAAKIVALRQQLGLPPLAAPAAEGFFPCDDRDARIAFERADRERQELLRDKRYDALDKRYDAILRDVAEGRVADYMADREFYAFDLGIGTGPLHVEWVRLHPQSSAAHLGYAYFLVFTGYRGLDAGRDGKGPRKVTADARESFRAAVTEIVLAERDPRTRTLANALRIRIAAADPQAGAGDPMALYRAGMKAAPKSITPRAWLLRAASPAVGGDPSIPGRVLEDAKGMDAASRRYLVYVADSERGKAAEAAGKLADAERALESSAAACPGLDDSLQALAKVQQRLGSHAGLLKTVGRLLDRDPHDGWALWLRATSLHAMGRDVEAAADLRRATELAYMPAVVALGDLYETGTGVPRDVRRALELYEIAESADEPGAAERIERLKSTKDARAS